MNLKDFKEASPIEFSEYAAANKIDDETALSWCMHYVFKKRYMIIAKSNTKS